jgi:acetyl-CoA carboxylase biotin carboxyl carrier protein
MTDELERPTADEPARPTADAGEPERTTADEPERTTADAGDSSLLALLDRLTGLLERSDLIELEVEAGQTGLVLRKPAALVASPAIAPGLAAPAAGSVAEAGSAVGSVVVPGSAAEAPATAGPPIRPSVKAPLTGIFYGSPAPGSAPYVQVGGEIVVGQVIGLIEAMKLFNEIKSDLAGRVVRVVAESGQLVKAKQPLIEVEPL